ncbi:MAG: hypothetical protein KGL39_21720 [Patescibacteria group bacterium]|nr:hypothetical protein [Patescibacteria group bacterium]
MALEQILIRMGLDAKAVVSGLNKVSSLSKGWATGFVQDMRTTMGRMFIGYFGIQGLEMGARKAVNIMEEANRRALAIRNDARNLGVSTNFIQGIMMEANKAGYAYEQIEKPLSHLNDLLQDARIGSIDARTKLLQFGIATKDVKWDSLNLGDVLSNLAEQQKKSGNAAASSYRDAQLMGKGWQSLIPILQQGGDAIKKLNDDAWFKVSPDVIAKQTAIYGYGKTGSQGLGAIMAGLSTHFLSGAYRLFEMIKLNKAAFSDSEWKKNNPLMLKGEEINKQQELNDAVAYNNELLYKQVELNNQILKKTLERDKAEARIQDRYKPTLEQMADRTRKLLGLPTPEELNFTISPQDLQALRIDTLRRQAGVAYERGQGGVAKGLISESDQAAAGLGNTFNFAARNPLREFTIAADTLSASVKALQPIADAAKIVTQEHSIPK